MRDQGGRDEGELPKFRLLPGIYFKLAMSPSSILAFSFVPPHTPLPPIRLARLLSPGRASPGGVARLLGRCLRLLGRPERRCR